MKCFNCGQIAHSQEENCVYCNIPLSYYGLIQEVSGSPIVKQKIEGCQCPNCSGMQNDPKAFRCEYCNFPLDNHDKSAGKKTASSESEPVFAWRNVGQSRFSMNYDRSIEELLHNRILKFSI